MAPGTRSQQAAGRSTQRQQSRKSYREDSTESERNLSDDGSEDYEAPSSPPRRQRRPRRSVRSLPSSENISKKRKAADAGLPTFRTKKTRPSESKSKCETGATLGSSISRGQIPPWHTLPYHILYQVFLHASQPLFTEVSVPTSSTWWLVRTALVCKSFAEPALSVLYYAPPLSPPSRARDLLLHLQGQDDRSTFNYRSKVKYLDFEAGDTLFRKYKGQDPVDVGELLAVTPQLRGIGLHLLSDFKKGRQYPFPIPKLKATQVLHTIVIALKQYGLQLQEWKWNILTAAAFLGADDYSAMRECHATPSFQRITKLTISRLFTSKLDSKMPEELLASAISALPDLQELQLAASPLANVTLLPLLPQGLQSIGITECAINAKTLAAFLASHGQSIRHLTLDHNKALNLSFLVDLARSCPLLESLSMDLTYYDSHSTFSDSDPQFDSLLPPNEIPTWPSSLQKIELLHLRKWDNEVAETFFCSLLDAAPRLLNLRYLNIKASLNESGWRERVSFRDRWVATLHKVFLRVSLPPNPYLRSIAVFKAYKSKQAYPIDAEPSVLPPFAKYNSMLLRKPGRAGMSSDAGQKRKFEATAEAGESGSSDEPLVRKRRSTRLQQHGESSCSSNTNHHRRRPNRRRHSAKASDDESSSEDSAIDDDTSLTSHDQTSQHADGSNEPFVQGMCDMVRILIDNLRPTEEQLAESDFLDEEPSGDEDWNGDDDAFGNEEDAW